MDILDRKSLIKAADELTEIMGLKPALDTELESDALQAAIIEAATEIGPDDVFSDKTTKTLTTLGCIKTATTPVEKESSKSKKKAEKEEAEAQAAKRAAEKAAEKKSAAKSGKSAEKSGEATEKPVKKDGAKKLPVDRSKSNKAVVYKLWTAGTKDPEKLSAKVNNAVKLTTIKAWLNQWKNKKNLPSVAK